MDRVRVRIEELNTALWGGFSPGSKIMFCLNVVSETMPPLLNNWI